MYASLIVFFFLHMQPYECDPTFFGNFGNELLVFFLHLYMHLNVLLITVLIIKTSFYLKNCHFGCGYKRDVLQNGTR